MGNFNDGINLKITKAKLPTVFGLFDIYAFKDKNNGKESAVLVKNPIGSTPVVRIHSQCITGDIFFSVKCDCRSQLEFSMNYIQKKGGILIYLFQEGRDIGFFNKIRAYHLQDNGMDTVDANLKLGLPVDGRTYKLADKILLYFKNKFSFEQIKLLTNNPAKVKGLDCKVSEIIHPKSTVTTFNKKYLKTKKERMGHDIDINIDI